MSTVNRHIFKLNLIQSVWSVHWLLSMSLRLVTRWHCVSCLGNACPVTPVGLIVGVNIIVIVVIVIVAVVVVVLISRRLRSQTDDNPASNSQVYSELQANSNNAPVYTHLQNTGADTTAEAPSQDDLYENT